MNMTESETDKPAAPAKPKRKWTRRARRPPIVRTAPPAPPGPEADPLNTLLAGITVADCCDDCGPNCVISGDICVHPRKGGLHAAHQMNDEVRKRFNRAKKILEQQELDKKPG